MDTEMSLDSFLSNDTLLSLYHPKDLQLLTTIQRLINDPVSSNLLFLGDKVFTYDITSDHSNHQSTDSVHFSIKEVGPYSKLNKFTMEILSVSGYDVQLCACAKHELMMQIFTEPKRGKTELTTLLLSLDEDEVEVRVIPNITEVFKAYGATEGGTILYTDKLRPSFMHLLDTMTFAQKTFQLANMKEWISNMCVSPTEATCEKFICIISDTKEMNRMVPNGKLVCFSALEDYVIAESNDYIVSSEILKFTPDGKYILTGAQQPCSLYVIDSISLEICHKIKYLKYCPFLGLPFELPLKIAYLQETEVIKSIPTAKVVERCEGLTGLALVDSKMYFLLPVLSIDGKTVLVVHLNIGDSDNNSKVNTYKMNEEVTE